MPDGATRTGNRPIPWPRDDDQRLSVLCDELEKGLGAFGFLWLCACAVYPGLRFPLSVYLGRRLAEAVGRPPPKEDEHLAMFRLPWFRTGWMPEDLRLALLERLDPAMRPVVRKAIERLLFSALEDEKRDPAAAPPLDFARAPHGWRTMLRGWLEAVPPGVPARDTIFVHYMLGRVTKPSDLRLGRTLSRLFGARLAGWFDRRTLTRAALAIAATTAFWLLADNIIRPLFTIARFGPAAPRAKVVIQDYGKHYQLYRGGVLLGTTPYEFEATIGERIQVECRTNNKPVQTLAFEVGNSNDWVCRE